MLLTLYSRSEGTAQGSRPGTVSSQWAPLYRSIQTGRWEEEEWRARKRGIEGYSMKIWKGETVNNEEGMQKLLRLGRQVRMVTQNAALALVP